MPKPSPKIYLPDRFKHTTTELEDGTIVILADDHVVPIQERSRPAAVVEIRPTEEVVPETTPSRGEDSPAEVEVEVDVFGPLRKGETRRPPEPEEPLTERERNLQQQLEKNQKNPDPLADDQSLVSRAERRRLIKEEIKRLSHVEGPAYQRRLW